MLDAEGYPRAFLETEHLRFESRKASRGEDRVKHHQAITSADVTRLAGAWLRQRARAARPWFLFAHYFDPHSQYRLHEGVSEDFGTALRAGCSCEVVDPICGAGQRNIGSLAGVGRPA